MAEVHRARLREISALALDLAGSHHESDLVPYGEDFHEALEGLRAVESHLPDPDTTRSRS